MITEAAAGMGSGEFSTGIAPQILRNVPLFREFDDEQLAELARLVTVHRYRKHQTIVREGDPGQEFFIVVEGSVAVVRDAGEGRETILSILKASEFFGEMSLFEN